MGRLGSHNIFIPLPFLISLPLPFFMAIQAFQLCSIRAIISRSHLCNKFVPSRVPVSLLSQYPENFPSQYILPYSNVYFDLFHLILVLPKSIPKYISAALAAHAG